MRDTAEIKMQSDHKTNSVDIIPKDWRIKRLGDLYQFKNGLNKEKEFFGYGTSIINYMDVFKNNALNRFNVKGKVSLNKSEIERFNTRKGDVFFTRTSETINEIAYSSVLEEDIEDCVFSGFVLRARPTGKQIDISFAKYCFSTSMARKEIIRKSTFTTRALTNGRFLSEVNLLIPPLPEQQKIAKILATWDKAIAKQEALISQKQKLKKGLMQQLLTGKKRFKGFDGEWKNSKLGNLTNIKAGGTPSKAKPEYWNGNIRWMNSGELNLKKVSEVEGRINPLGLKNSSTNLLPKYCVLIGLAGQGKTRGTAAINLVELCTNQSVAAILPSEKFDSFFMYHLLDSKYDLLRQLSAGDGGRGGLNLKILNGLKVSVPKKEEQTLIASLLNKADKTIEKLQQQLEFLRTQKQGLMQKLLTGEVRVKV